MLAVAQPGCHVRHRMNNSRTTNSAPACREQAASATSTLEQAKGPLAGIVRPSHDSRWWRVSPSAPTGVTQTRTFRTVLAPRSALGETRPAFKRAGDGGYWWPSPTPFSILRIPAPASRPQAWGLGGDTEGVRRMCPQVSLFDHLSAAVLGMATEGLKPPHPSRSLNKR